jgi:hypothetical protein
MDGMYADEENDPETAVSEPIPKSICVHPVHLWFNSTSHPQPSSLKVEF